MENINIDLTMTLDEFIDIQDDFSDEECEFFLDHYFAERQEDPNMYYGVLFRSSEEAEEFSRRRKEDEARAKINEEKKAKALAEGKSNTISTLGVIAQIAGIFLL